MKTTTTTTTSLHALACAAFLALAGCSDAAAVDGASVVDPMVASEDADGDEQTGTTDFSDPVEDNDDARINDGPMVGVDDAAIDAPDDDVDGASNPPATGASPPPPPTKKPPTISSYVVAAISKPNQFFKRQVRHSTWNPTGPLSSGNCAPTSLAMIAKVFGLEPKGLTIEQSIDRVRLKMNKWSDSGGSSAAQVRLGASRLGFKYRAMPKGNLDIELAQGHMVVLVGYPGLSGTATASRYQNAFRLAGYHYTFDAYHSIAVFGKTASGRYIVADPMSKVGAITMSALQMSDYWKRWGGSGTAVWR